MDYLNRLEYEAIAAAVGLDNNIHEGVYQAQAAHRVIVTNRIPDSDLTPKELAYVQAVRGYLNTGLIEITAARDLPVDEFQQLAATPTEPEVTASTPEASILPVAEDPPVPAQYVRSTGIEPPVPKQMVERIQEMVAEREVATLESADIPKKSLFTRRKKS